VWFLDCRESTVPLPYLAPCPSPSICEGNDPDVRGEVPSNDIEAEN